MRKQYFSDCLLQIALLWSLFRIDSNNFSVPNNELLNYPEVQDILQGQTLALLPTNFHNQYNTLDSIHGYAHPKHADNDIYHSAIFRELRRFRHVPTNIEAFLASNDDTVGFPPLQQGNIPLGAASSSSGNGNGEEESGVSGATGQAQVTLDANHNAVCAQNEPEVDNPFPGLNLCKEDLDLIEVLWRQDVDLGVTKEVFDPNLRRELEQEREIEARKELEKHKEVEKRSREQQQQAHQWLTENFVRDGETGEWMPIAGSGTANNTNFSASGPAALYPEPPLVQQPQSLTLEEALNFVGELSNHSYVQQLPQQQAVVAPLPSNHSVDVASTFEFVPDSLFEETGVSAYAQHNHTDPGRLETSWQEVVDYLSDITSTATSTTVNNPALTMPPVDTHILMPPAPDAASLHQPPTVHPHHHQLQQHDFHAQQQLNHSQAFGGMPERNHTMSAASSMNETRRLLRHNSTTTELNSLTGLLNQTGMILQNVTLPAVPTPLDNNLPSLPVINETGLVKQDYNSSTPATENLNSLEWEGGELFFPNITDFDNLTNAIANSSMLDPSDLLNSMLPAEDLDMNFDPGLDTIQMLDDAGSDSAISMGSVSPHQEVNETMETSPFEGLEGATGGSDYDSTSYGNRRTYTHSSGSAEDDGFHYSCSSYGSPASVNTNCSTGSNDTEHSSGQSSASLNHIHHNHTYPTQPGQTPREVKKYAKRDGPRQKGPHSRDAKRAEDLKLPFTFDHIIESAVEEFNDMITKTKLTEAQINLMRDIRRRGKNKVAAQNCRKRKLDVLVTLEDQMDDMQHARDKLAAERRDIELQTRQAREKYSALYDHIFRSLRDEQGRPYSPDEFSLQQSSDGNVFLVRLTNASATAPVASAASGSRSTPNASSTKRKDYPRQQKKKSKE
ncbi:endoplasmic reticulum membrane sensor NFE2L1-like isoform X2 [Littorina saxatilis]|uniref:endoplasmic reticulum membrane sensor NFE2L1-like isoform X2 n=1 Tax=Littorina saxatilis TaxID=31220 RepID=UPI0038B64F3A